MSGLAKAIGWLASLAASALAIYTFVTGNTTLAEGIGLGQIARVVVNSPNAGEPQPVVRSTLADYSTLLEDKSPSGQRIIYAQKKRRFLPLYDIVRLDCDDSSCTSTLLMPVPLAMEQIDSLDALDDGRTLIGLSRNGRGFLYNLSTRTFSVFRIAMSCSGRGFHKAQGQASGLFAVRNRWISDGRVTYVLNALGCSGAIAVAGGQFPLAARGGYFELEVSFEPDPLGLVRAGEARTVRWSRQLQPEWFSFTSQDRREPPSGPVHDAMDEAVLNVLRKYRSDRLEVWPDIEEIRLMNVMDLTGRSRDQILGVDDQSSNRDGMDGLYFTRDTLFAKPAFNPPRRLDYKSLHGQQGSRFLQVIKFGEIMVPAYAGDPDRVRSMISDLSNLAVDGPPAS